MDTNKIQLPHRYQIFINRFISACESDERIVAAFLTGSFARGTADQYSDLDLCLITRDNSYADFIATRETFFRSVGKLLFLEDFGNPETVFTFFDDGIECEFSIGSESHYHQIHSGAYITLLDKKGILVNAVFSEHNVDEHLQIQKINQQITWFWHEFSHFTKAMGRRQLWFAYGQLEAMRRMCVNLARLKYNFSDSWVGDEPYFKLEEIFPIDQLAPLRGTFCPISYEKILEAAFSIYGYYHGVALDLAKIHGLSYPSELDHLLFNPFEKLAKNR